LQLRLLRARPANTSVALESRCLRSAGAGRLNVQNQRFMRANRKAPAMSLCESCATRLFGFAQLRGVFYGAAMAKTSLTLLLSPTTMLVAGV